MNKNLLGTKRATFGHSGWVSTRGCAPWSYTRYYEYEYWSTKKKRVRYIVGRVDITCGYWNSYLRLPVLTRGRYGRAVRSWLCSLRKSLYWWPPTMAKLTPNRSSICPFFGEEIGISRKSHVIDKVTSNITIVYETHPRGTCLTVLRRTYVGVLSHLGNEQYDLHLCWLFIGSQLSSVRASGTLWMN